MKCTILFAKFKALLHNGELRLKTSEAQLARLKTRHENERIRLERLQSEIALQRQQGSEFESSGVAIDRQQLFSWLRKNAMEKRRTQELRLELAKQEEICATCENQAEAQRLLSSNLEKRRQKYLKLVATERRKIAMKNANFEDHEAEEYVALWTYK